MRVICVVPEMDTIQGFCTISHDSAIWAGTACSRTAHLFTNSTSAKFRRRFSLRCLWLILIAIHFDRPKQMRERELGELPLAVFLDINLSHHKRIGDFVLTDYCLQIDVL